jgi:GTP:adenosylcobinamide-phosphate guanylyltransferase
MEKPALITAAILAGQRPGIDPLAAASGQIYKALVPVSGRPMVAYVLETLLTHPRVGTVLLLGQDTQAILDGIGNATLANHKAIKALDGPDSIAQAVEAALQQTEGPLLVTTADHVLLSHAMIDQMLTNTQNCEVAVGMVEQQRLLADHPDAKRTWIKFRGEAYSGANLFLLCGGAKLSPLLTLWRSIEADRKKGWRILTAFGPRLAIGAVLRLWTGNEALERAGRRFGLRAHLVSLPQAEACIDVDKPADKQLVEAILALRADPNFV